MRGFKLLFIAGKVVGEIKESRTSAGCAWTTREEKEHWGQEKPFIVYLYLIHVFIYFSSIELFYFDWGTRLNLHSAVQRPADSPFDWLLITMG